MFIKICAVLLIVVSSTIYSQENVSKKDTNVSENVQSESVIVSEAKFFKNELIKLRDEGYGFYVTLGGAYGQDFKRNVGFSYHSFGFIFKGLQAGFSRYNLHTRIDSPNEVGKDLTFNYKTFDFGYSVVKNSSFQIIPVASIGMSDLTSIDEVYSKNDDDFDRPDMRNERHNQFYNFDLWLVQLQTQADFFINDWVSINLGVGYRWNFGGIDKEIKLNASDLNGFNGTASLKIGLL